MSYHLDTLLDSTRRAECAKNDQARDDCGADELESVRAALRDVRAADDCASYKVRIHQQWHGDVLVAFAFPLPHWVVLAGLEAMERELVAQAEVA